MRTHTHMHPALITNTPSEVILCRYPCVQITSLSNCQCFPSLPDQYCIDVHVFASVVSLGFVQVYLSCNACSVVMHSVYCCPEIFCIQVKGPVAGNAIDRLCALPLCYGDSEMKTWILQRIFSNVSFFPPFSPTNSRKEQGESTTRFVTVLSVNIDTLTHSCSSS